MGVPTAILGISPDEFAGSAGPLFGPLLNAYAESGGELSHEQLQAKLARRPASTLTSGARAGRSGRGGS
jgi:hypothetical protein